MYVIRGLLAAAIVVLAGVTATPAAGAAGIPDEALLQASDLGGVTPHATDGDDWPQLRPPRPCGAGVPAPVTDRAVAAVIDVDGAPESIMEYLAVHRDAGRYLRKLRKAVDGCPDWRVEESAAGRLTLRWTQRWEHVGEEVTHQTYVAVARTGRAVVVVADNGWETSDGDPAVAQRLLISAVRRASSLS
ncbi:hypothetical protein Aph02nite_11270 [Actinoplanes philippinensis]|uniref:PknH-like extracellular domain-containing protein n=1 Tax=Actinoplanes philippinensis TaxID=35752 RepID=A0A1I2A0Z4_9ACTN|nr:hypothetical protein [Actinoplanes philippinensis]GIE75177.1 hypothetical protein Aph02nite_11270 [Actinoplanes philippinensis]SFE37278.1 hypothetical protein SAMN05421541_101419 [Actinoplanes philippinensis]